METVLKIAGTTIGGTGYTRRMIRHMEDTRPDRMRVVITKGARQKQVYERVKNELLGLYSFVNNCGGKMPMPVDIEMEK